MGPTQLEALIKSLSELQSSASFAQKYGPYFFAVALLIAGPFVCRIIFSKSIASSDALVQKRSLEDFRFYFRATVIVGMISVLTGIGWWLIESNRQDSRTAQTVEQLQVQLNNISLLMKSMNYTAYGVISTGVQAQDTFYATFPGPQTSIFFAKLPVNLVQSEASWFFVVVSNEKLPNPLDITVGWSHQQSNMPAAPILSVPVRITLAKKYGLYKFSLEGVRAMIQPIAN